MCVVTALIIHLVIIVLTSYFFFNDTATTEIYTYGHTLSLHDALPISSGPVRTCRIATDRSPERRTSRDESFPLPVAPDPSRHSPVLSHNGKGPLPPIWLAEHQATRSSPIGCQRAVCPGPPNQPYAERKIGRAHVSTPVTHAQLVCRP